MRTIYCMISLTIMLALLGCATLQNASVTKIGKNRYELSVDSMTDPDGAFTKKAKEICPGGYKVIERTKRGDILVTLVGTIECEANGNARVSSANEEAKEEKKGEKTNQIEGVTKIGKNRYELSVDSMTDPDGAFTKKAKEICPGGYKVIERTKRGSILVTLVGTIECEANGNAKVGVEPSPRSMTVLQIQQRLSELGYNPGPADGIMGKSTVGALKKFQQDNGLSKTGKVDSETVAKLRQKTGGGVKPPSNQKPPTPVKPKTPANSKTSSPTDL